MRGFHNAPPVPHSHPMDPLPYHNPQTQFVEDSFDSEMQQTLGGGMYHGAPQYQNQWQMAGSHGMGVSRRGGRQTAAASAPFANDYSWQFEK